MAKAAKSLSAADSKTLLNTLKSRFVKHQQRHKSVDWATVEARLVKKPERMWTLQQMEDSGGEPDVVQLDKKKDSFFFVDCAAESPKERRSLCYDKAALSARKENKPRDNAMDVADEMGLEILTEEEYRLLQTLGEFDLKTSSWIQTPPEVRKLGGALFCDRRFNKVFTYHNGAESYYAARGFRGKVEI